METIEIKFNGTDITDKIMVINQLRVKELKDKDGNTEFDNYAITSDEYDYIKDFLAAGAAEMGEMVAPLTSGITDAVSLVDPFGVTIVDNGNNNKNNTTVLTKQFEEFMIATVLYKWYEMKGLFDDFKLWSSKAQAHKLNIMHLAMFTNSIRST